MGSKPRLLFLCTGNACRSQMAEGWARALHAERFEIASAGIAPGTLDPRAVRAMAEAGVDIAGQRPKSVGDLAGRAFDWVITVCDLASERCPVFPGPAQRLHRGFDDPPRLAAAARSDDEAIAVYRRVRDEIREFVETLPARLARGDGGGARQRAR